MKLFLVHTMLFVVSICKNKSGWFLFDMSLWGWWWSQKCCWQLGSITDFGFLTQLCWRSSPHDTKEPMKLFLVHTMLFVVSICKNKSGWFLFDMSLGLLVVTQILLLTAWILDTAFQPNFCLRSNLHDTKKPMKLYLFHTMLFDGPYVRIKVVDSCLICPWGCWWSQKLCC
jgi:hypothetical protein